ncbi:hypothetical protein Tco_0493152 [Tanacetum coccineum]
MVRDKNIILIDQNKTDTVKPENVKMAYYGQKLDLNAHDGNDATSSRKYFDFNGLSWVILSIYWGVWDCLHAVICEYYKQDLKRVVHGNITLGGTSTTSSTIWERICQHKLPVVEPRQTSLFPEAIEVTFSVLISNSFLCAKVFTFERDYMTKLRDTSSKGAVFFVVCRGKVFAQTGMAMEQYIKDMIEYLIHCIVTAGIYKMLTSKLKSLTLAPFQFLEADFTFILFHYDGRMDGSRDL